MPTIKKSISMPRWKRKEFNKCAKIYGPNNEILVQEKINLYLFSPLSVWRSLSCWHLSQDWTRINIHIVLVSIRMYIRALVCIMECLAKDWCAMAFPDNCLIDGIHQNANKAMHFDEDYCRWSGSLGIPYPRPTIQLPCLQNN